jgi:hypothetical protein
MSFPTVAGRNNSADGADATSHTVALPASIASGDLLIVHFVVDGSPTITWPANWVSIADRGHGDGSASKSACAYKIADGTEGASISVTTSASEKAASRSWRITGWHGTTVPEAATSAGNDAAPDPPNLSPSWGAEDTLWLALHGHENTSTSVTAYPTNYVDTFGQGTSGASAATNVIQAVAERSLNAASENPGAFTLNGSRVWANFTVAIRPGAGGTVVNLGLDTETEAALAATLRKTAALGLGTETEAASAASVRKDVATGLASETEASQPVAVQKVIALGLPVETEAALPVSLGGTQVIPLGLISETETPQSAAVLRNVTLGLPAESESAFTTAIRESVALGLPTETEASLSAKSITSLVLGQPVETEGVFATSTAKAVPWGMLTETETALPMGLGGPITISLGLVTEVETALAATTTSEEVPVATYRFVPPDVTRHHPMYASDPVLSKFTTYRQGLTVVKRGGTYVTEESTIRDGTDGVEGIDYFLGGHVYTGIPDGVAAELIADGYSPTVE